MTTDDDAMIATLSDYLDGGLADAQRAEVEHKIATDDAWKEAHKELRETRDHLSGLQKARAPSKFTQGVTETIYKRSGGRFFARDRPLFIALVIALILLVGIAGVLWTSSTGSLKIERDKPGSQGSGIIDEP